MLILLLPLSVANSATPPPDDTNAKIKSTYLYNFTKYIEWPSKTKQGNFIIGVLGSSNLASELNIMAATKKVGEQDLEIKIFNGLDALSKCHILYISADMASNFQAIVNKIKGQSTLLITEKPGLAKQGSAINFVVQNNKQLFELNKANAEKHELTVSSKLEQLALKVE